MFLMDNAVPKAGSEYTPVFKWNNLKNGETNSRSNVWYDDGKNKTLRSFLLFVLFYFDFMACQSL